MNVKNGSYASTKLFLNSAVTNQLSSTPIYIYPAGTSDVTTDDIRNALGEAGGNIKQCGKCDNGRRGDKGKPLHKSMGK